MYTLNNYSFVNDIHLHKGIVITDPPYNQGYHYSKYKDNLSLDSYVELLSNIPTPCVIIHYPEETINLLPLLYGECEQVVSWVYNSNTGKQHRLISWWGCKPDFSKVKQAYKNPKDKRVAELVKRTGGAKLYDWWEVQQVKNVSKEKTKHPCQIPEEIIRRIILTTVKTGDTILDPFLGSGTTGKVAVELGYDFVGWDIDSEYVQISDNRIKNIIK